MRLEIPFSIRIAFIENTSSISSVGSPLRPNSRKAKCTHFLINSHLGLTCRDTFYYCCQTSVSNNRPLGAFNVLRYSLLEPVKWLGPTRVRPEYGSSSSLLFPWLKCVNHWSLCRRMKYRKILKLQSGCGWTSESKDGISASTTTEGAAMFWTRTHSLHPKAKLPEKGRVEHSAPVQCPYSWTFPGSLVESHGKRAGWALKFRIREIRGSMNTNHMPGGRTDRNPAGPGMSLLASRFRRIMNASPVPNVWFSRMVLTTGRITHITRQITPPHWIIVWIGSSVSQRHTNVIYTTLTSNWTLFCQ